MHSYIIRSFVHNSDEGYIFITYNIVLIILLHIQNIFLEFALTMENLIQQSLMKNLKYTIKDPPHHCYHKQVYAIF